MSYINIVMLGEAGVGKSCLLNQFKTGHYSNLPSTVLVDQFKTTVKIRGIETTVVFWDTAGQERFHSLVRKYFALADGVVLAYNVNSYEENELSKWLRELRYNNDTAEVIVAANQIDKVPVRQRLDRISVQTFAAQENLEFIQVSAKTGENVDKLFHALIEKILVKKGILKGKKPKNNCERKEPEIFFSYTKSVNVENAKNDSDKIQLGEDTGRSEKRCSC